MMFIKTIIFGLSVILIEPIFPKVASSQKSTPTSTSQILEWGKAGTYIREFNQEDDELYVQYIQNNEAEKFLAENIPYFNCPDQELEKTYYFRWWTYRKHIKNTVEGFVITEFLPEVSWAGKYNTICCAAGHHFYEGRWLHNQEYLVDYANFWFRGVGDPKLYSFWAANSILAFASVHSNKKLIIDLLPFLDKNYIEWEKRNLSENGLFWQVDDADGMEVSAGCYGEFSCAGERPTINSYMYGDARAINEIAKIADNKKIRKDYSKKSRQLRLLILKKLWDKKAEFFKTISKKSLEFVDVRELYGYTPWYFNIPESKHSVAWKFLNSDKGFKATYGPTTAEQSHPGFKISYEGHECQWNGPSWPYSTSITLKAMGNLLRNYNQSVISKKDFIKLLITYSNSHRRINEKGKEVCWIDENLNPYTGDWISRTMLKAKNSKRKERGKDYNHSAFCDIIISDLVGIRPSMGKNLIIEPLIEEEYWDWFCLDNVKYHEKVVTVLWDKDGSKYHLHKGFSVIVDGKTKYNSPRIPRKIKISL